MDILAYLAQPESQTDPYVWLVVLMAHCLIGLILTGLVAGMLSWTDLDPLPSAVQIVTGAYLFGWEIIVQRIGAGWADLVIDTGAVLLGGLIAWGAWANRGPVVAFSVFVLGVVGIIGTGKRS